MRTPPKNLKEKVHYKWISFQFWYWGKREKFLKPFKTKIHEIQIWWYFRGKCRWCDGKGETDIGDGYASYMDTCPICRGTGRPTPQKLKK